MTRDVTPDLQRIRLFLTEPHSCSYLPDRQAVTAFVDPEIQISSGLYDRLSEMGFRRSGQFMYTPHCEGCRKCVSTRILVGRFKPNRSQRRCLARNRDLTRKIRKTIGSEEHYHLYERYIEGRHRDGDMYPPSMQQYQDFIGSPWETTRFLEFRLDGELLAVSVMDILPSGVSAIYTYFDPQEENRGLGTLAILALVELARQANLPYVYLGYWIKECRKMSYKTSFRPIELYLDKKWTEAG